jgi:hypothetical protein
MRMGGGYAAQGGGGRGVKIGNLKTKIGRFS